ncbi:iron-containing alcohol dehydrogenase family protein [Vagococcus elongatus]|uniref:Oxidoreductase n=1 Tax=Vagococcus elongatus TaxID=180344 RepID=A0A430AZX4_9ENTE|nr:iron-containing alcohol dehydrogenase family protein [Vagococcus elongatus]RSU13586.1 oxidoreductase [Vagococcus elongatus]
MKMNLVVRGAPQEYICKTGSWQELPDHLAKRGVENILVLHGEKSWKAAEPYFPDLSDFQVLFRHYGNHCTDTLRDQHIAVAKENQIDTVVAVGGGKISDLGKMIAHEMKIRIVILPTLAATCAAYSSLSSVYNDNGEHSEMRIFPYSTDLVLVEPEMLLDSPEEYLIAGIGDTIAKWYESNAIISQLEEKSVAVEIAQSMAKKCRDNLLEYSSEAIKAHGEKNLTEAFKKVIETNIMLAGLVGGFGDDYGRTAGAHTIHDALTVVPESRAVLHGNKVAYGILVQLVIEDKWEEIKNLQPFYEELGLPLSLKDMKIPLDGLDKVVEKAASPKEFIHLLAKPVNQQVIKEAMLALEDYMTN